MTTKTIRFMRLAAQVLLSVAICDIILTPTLACALIGGNYLPLIVCGVFAVIALTLFLVTLRPRQPGGPRAVAASDVLPRVPWYCRFYRFLTDDGVRFVEFATDSDILRHACRYAWRPPVLIVFVFLVVVLLLLSHIGFFILLAPFLIPIAALIGSVVAKWNVQPCSVRIDGQDYKLEGRESRVSRSVTVKVLVLVLAGLCFPLVVLFAISPEKVLDLTEKFERAHPIAFPMTTLALIFLSLWLFLKSKRERAFRYECSTGLSPQPQFRKVFSYPKLVYVDVGPCDESKESGPRNEAPKIALRCRSSTGRPFRAFAVTYVIVYALFLLSTPFRPLPLDPPPPELMAKIHPCLLDEDGNVRRRQIVVVEGIRNSLDWECAITNGTHREFDVLSAFHTACDDFKDYTDTPVGKFLQETRDLAKCSETNFLTATVENKAGFEEWCRRGRKVIDVAEAATGPQLGYWSCVPDFASPRGEHISILCTCSPIGTPYLTGMRVKLQLGADSGDPEQLRNDLAFLSEFLGARDRYNGPLAIDNFASQLLRTFAVSATLRMAEVSTVEQNACSPIESAFCFGGTNLYEKNLSSACEGTTHLLTTAVVPVSGTSMKKALKQLFARHPSTPYCLPSDGEGGSWDAEAPCKDGVLTRYCAVSTVLWCPPLAFLNGYDTKAQMSVLKHRKEWHAVLVSAALDGADPIKEMMKSAGMAHPLGRGGLLLGFDHFIFDHRFGLTLLPNVKPRLLQAYYADRYDHVVSAALRLSQFRGEKGRDAASLEEVEEAFSWKRKTDADIEVVYRPVTPPEGSAEGTFAYVIGLQPKDGCRKAFENTGVAWLVVRNPNFAGTLKRRFMTLEQYDRTGDYVKSLSWDLRIGDEDGKDDPFVLPSAFFGDDPAALEEAVKTMKKRGWAL